MVHTWRVRTEPGSPSWVLSSQLRGQALFGEISHSEKGARWKKGYRGQIDRDNSGESVFYLRRETKLWEPLSSGELPCYSFRSLVTRSDFSFSMRVMGRGSERKTRRPKHGLLPSNMSIKDFKRTFKWRARAAKTEYYSYKGTTWRQNTHEGLPVLKIGDKKRSSGIVWNWQRLAKLSLARNSKRFLGNILAFLLIYREIRYGASLNSDAVVERCAGCAVVAAEKQVLLSDLTCTQKERKTRGSLYPHSQTPCPASHSSSLSYIFFFRLAVRAILRV